MTLASEISAALDKFLAQLVSVGCLPDRRFIATH
jgi:hypothetical protein